MVRKTAIVVMNLGTPDAPTPKAVKKYLLEFLSDRRVIERQGLLWQIILRGIILQVRPRKSAKAYASVFMDNGESPLLHYTNAIAQQLQIALGNQVIVKAAMRYGNPSTASVLDELTKQSVDKIIFLPLYPQFSFTTTASCFDIIAQYYYDKPFIPELQFLTEYYTQEKYIDAIAKSIEKQWNINGRSEKLVMSFHGLPQRYIAQGDPYYCQSIHTGQLIAQKLNLKEQDYLITFQSRFGPEKWLTPYTDKTLETLGKEGVKSVDIICPGFSCDCLETLEEISDENREVFEKAGGEKYHYIPCLNASEDAIELFTHIIKPNI